VIRVVVDEGVVGDAGLRSVSWTRDSIFRAPRPEPRVNWNWLLILTRVVASTMPRSKKHT
jgi:hypothetical protein